MRSLASRLCALVSVVLVAGCHSAESAPAESPGTTTGPIPVSHVETGSGDCTAGVTAPVSIAMRPHSTEQFGQLDPNTPVVIQARSMDGWLGFDPAVAQAANVGPFRLRWLDPAKVSTHGNCAHLPLFWTPKPGVCFQMNMEDVPVREAPVEGARPLVILHPGEFAAVVASAGKDWVKLDLSDGNTGSAVKGFIPMDAVNVNGPCDAILGR